MAELEERRHPETGPGRRRCRCRRGGKGEESTETQETAGASAVEYVWRQQELGQSERQRPSEQERLWEQERAQGHWWKQEREHTGASESAASAWVTSGAWTSLGQAA